MDGPRNAGLPSRKESTTHAPTHTCCGCSMRQWSTPDLRRSPLRMLCSALAPRIRLYALRHLRDESAAADITQEALITIVERAREGRIENPDHVDRFALGVCRNLVARVRRGEVRTRRFESAARMLTEEVLPPAFTRLDAARLALCFGQLRARDQRVLLLTFQEDFGADDIATELSMSPGNVRVVRHRAMSALQRCVEGAPP
jgi:RNA polymerase sigma-70 factor (ECF subfamily)